MTQSEQKSFIEQSVEWGGIWPESCALAKTLLKAINICITLALIFVYLTAQLKSNADGYLSQTYTSLGVFYFSSFFTLPVCLPTVHSETSKLISPAHSAVLQAKDLIDTGKLTMPAVYPFCIHLSYLSDVNTRRVPSLFSTRCSVLALWQEINCSRVSLPTSPAMISIEKCPRFYC